MRRGWSKIGRVATKENLADLNTKALSKERREYLAQLIGLHSDFSLEHTKYAAHGSDAGDGRLVERMRTRQ